MQTVQIDGLPPVPVNLASHIDRYFQTVAASVRPFDGREVERVRALLAQRKKVVVDVEITSGPGKADTTQMRVPILSLDDIAGDFVAFTCQYGCTERQGVVHGPTGRAAIGLSESVAF